MKSLYRKKEKDYLMRTTNVINPFIYEGVQLLDGRLKDQFNQIRDYYFNIPNDNILKEFRLEAGLPAPGKHLGGWYSDKGFGVFGQWLSAFARMYKVTKNEAIREKAIYLMDEWAKTISEDIWDRSMQHYPFDKIVGGLVDIYEYIGNKEALQYLKKITKWGEMNLDRSRPYAGAGMWGSEWYTLAENLYRAYELIGEKLYFDFAKVWEYAEYWGHFARGDDIFNALKNSQIKFYHAYSHVNTLSSAAMAYRVTGERHYLDAMINAYRYLQDTQCFATGGYGPDENLIMPDGLAKTLNDIEMRFHFETACGSWAAFKLALYLMMFTGEAHYGDWIERLIYNGVGALIPMNKHGTIMYGSKYHTHGSRKDLMREMTWSCCTGTLPQAVTDYHNLIYFYDRENLYVNLFVPSRVEWYGPECKVEVVQETRYPEEETVLIRMQPEAPSRFGIKFRVPKWAKKGVTVKVNNTLTKTTTPPAEWATVDRRWSPDDTITLKFDLSPRVEPLAGFVSPVAVLCGPAVMVPVNDPRGIPIGSETKSPGEWLKRSKERMEYSSSIQGWEQVFRPYYKLKEAEPYRMYFERTDGISILPDELLLHNAATGGKWFSDGTIRYAEEPGSYFEVKFKGTTIVWEGLRTEDAGMAQISIDGDQVTEADQYGYTGTRIAPLWLIHMERVPPWEPPFVWSTSHLDNGQHTIRVTISPNKNPASLGTKLNVKKVIAYP